MFDRLENEQMAFGVLPDLTTYNTVINAAGQAGDWRTALSLYESLLEVPLVPDQVCSLVHHNVAAVALCVGRFAALFRTTMYDNVQRSGSHIAGVTFLGLRARTWTYVRTPKPSILSGFSVMHSHGDSVRQSQEVTTGSHIGPHAGSALFATSMQCAAEDIRSSADIITSLLMLARTVGTQLFDLPRFEPIGGYGLQK